jgi:hypothetical protein
MPSLDRDLRKKLEKAVVEARKIAEAGALKALRELAVQEREAYPSMTKQQRGLRNRLRAHGRQLGDTRDAQRGTQTLDRLKQTCAYEHWHRMLFARFLAENELLLEPESQVAISLDDCRELARDQGRDWLELAAEYAQKMLLEVFRADDPVLEVALPPETQQQLEATLEGLDAAVFRADDSLGWVYQFWQAEEKERVNASGDKIGANELAPVTQLFTEDYMVLFLLENTLGAWWTAKRRTEGKDPALPGYEWTYLRLNEDGTPAAGPYEGWPRTARELRVLDPCMGSGHFLSFALPILARMRVEEEGLSLENGIAAVLRDNLFGLELDARCSQIAAFNLALTAWRMAGRHIVLPAMSLACSGLGIHAPEADWVKLAGNDYVADQWMRRLYSLFKDAPILGSLIDPARYLEKGQEAGLSRVLPLIEDALQQERSDEARELAVAAQGVLTTFQIVIGQFTLVATNVPFLKRGKQSSLLQDFCDDHYQRSRGNLALSMVERCIRFCSRGGTAAFVAVNELSFLGSYKKLREELLNNYSWNMLARLGSGAFETVSGEVVNVLLLAITRQAPSTPHEFVALDVERVTPSTDKATSLASLPLQPVSQGAQFRNPDSRVVLGDVSQLPLLSSCAAFGKGSTTGDGPHYHRCIWELPFLPEQVVPWLNSPDEGCLWSGRYLVLLVPVDDPGLGEEKGRWIRGQNVWGRRGVAVRKMGDPRPFLYYGEVFDDNIGVIAPETDQLIPPILSYCQSGEYLGDIRAIDQAIKVTAATLVKVPFDRDRWERLASGRYPDGLPTPDSKNPTQWLFNGHPEGSDYTLQVAIARLLGYRWPRQTGSSFPGCPALILDGLEEHADGDGIVCLSSIAGEPAAEQRLRNLLAEAFGHEWSAQKLSELLDDASSLKIWLRDRFFEEHGNLFHQRPFVWHIWDGRKDGFHALVNYHKLAGPNGEGRRTLEKLIYTSLGDWITRQRAEVASGADGAEARLLAAEHLQKELIKILEGEPPYDLFIRWKPLHEQPIGWEPDLNDGVRLNIRPWLQAKPYKSTRQNACILRVTPKSIKFTKDRGKEPVRDKEDYPWFWSWDQKTENFKGGDKFDGNRWNDLHYTRKEKQKARERHPAKGAGA